MRAPAKKTVYKVVFVNEGKVYEIYARSVSPSGLIGFVEVEGLLFGERSSMLVDPTEEKLRSEFAGVERTMIPMHSVVRVDQVAKRGTAKITAITGGSGDKLRPLSQPVFVPGKGDSSS
jgi:hypothetical protein